MSDDTGAKAPRRQGVGSFAPHVPYLNTGDKADRGPAGSLVQARARERTLRLADRPTPMRDWRLWAGGVLAVAALGLLVARLRLASSGPVLLLIAGAAVVGAVAAVCTRYQVGDVEADLSVQIARERRAARQLDTLCGLGWTVLHDRLVPGTEHRVAHVLAGPAGIVVATVLPVAGPVRARGDALLTGDVVLTEWFAARWWEAERINATLGERLADWPWTGPIYPVVMFPDDKPTRLRLRLARRTTAPATAAFPLVYAGIAIRATSRVRQWVTAMPAPLGRVAAAQLAAEVEAACPPAGARDE